MISRLSGLADLSGLPTNERLVLPPPENLRSSESLDPIVLHVIGHNVLLLHKHSQETTPQPIVAQLSTEHIAYFNGLQKLTGQTDRDTYHPFRALFSARYIHLDQGREHYLDSASSYLGRTIALLDALGEEAYGEPLIERVGINGGRGQGSQPRYRLNKALKIAYHLTPEQTELLGKS